ncbi:MAG: SDR family oxidoreductase [Caldilineaceae bacterium]|nr:SDR family oxidoreductase [Caldilineaceae bacterium]
MNGQTLTGKVALVTGGGGGIGAAICRRLAEAGAQVIINYNSNATKAQAVMESLAGEHHAMIQASVTDSAALAQLAQQVTERYGTLDLLVNNAGITRPVPHADLDGLDDEWIDRIFQTNVRGAFACVRAFKPLLMAGEGGTVINISSVAAVTGIGSNVAYCASKAAMDSLTRSLARALAPQIRVVSVAPGWVWGEYASRMEPAYIQEQINKTPLGRIAQPEDVAAAVLAVATGLTFTTGCIISVDGGRPLL